MAKRDTVTLDLWLTLIVDVPSTSTRSENRTSLRVERMSDAMAQAGHPVTAEQINEAFAATRGDMDHAHSNGVDRTFDLWIRQVVDHMHPRLFDQLSDKDADRIVAAADEPFIESPPSVHASALDILKYLKAEGLKVALISNTGFTSANMYRRWFAELGWLDYFDMTTFSNEACVAKPTVSIFHMTLDELNSEPGNAIHVGDQLRSDVMGAHHVGMSTVWIKGYDSSNPTIAPDYSVDDLSELPTVIDQWRNAD
ncbi:MAG: HAD family hydrolase [Chloroflexi bacterium]|nr:HAD family hydrolase [Chloroflexota bacterium]